MSIPLVAPSFSQSKSDCHHTDSGYVAQLVQFIPLADAIFRPVCQSDPAALLRQTSCSDMQVSQ